MHHNTRTGPPLWYSNTGRHERRRALILLVEGNIGSGKSTLREGLRKALKVFLESVKNEWKMPLQRFYSYLRRWGFAVQIEVLKWFKKLGNKELWTPCTATA